MSTAQAIEDNYSKFVIPTYAPEIALVKGSGSRVWDANGRVYYDFGTGISVNNVGHCHPVVTDAIEKQSKTLMHSSNLYFTENQGKLAARLSKLNDGGKVFFCNSGAEANEALIKLARLHGQEKGRHEIITMKNSFHGRTLATVAATGQDKVKKGFDPEMPGFRHAEFNDVTSVAEQINDKTVAILVEAVQGEGGVVPATEGFITGLKVLCEEHDILLMFDEVQCGLGRTGEWFGFQNFNVKPDAFSLAKALGGGFPIGAIVASPKVADVLQPGNHASTFGGAPLACSAALAMLDVVDSEALVKRAKTEGASFKAKLDGLVEKYEHVQDVRGIGLMLGIVLDTDAKPIVDQMSEIGLLTLATAGNVIRILPPLNAKDIEFEEAFEIIDECLAEMHGMDVDDEDVETEVDAVEETIPAEASSDEEVVVSDDH